MTRRDVGARTTAQRARSASSPLRIVSWNVLSGGRRRAGDLVPALTQLNPDVIVLHETMAAAAPAMCHALRDAGWPYLAGTPRPAGTKGVCVLSRVAFQRLTPPMCARGNERGWLELAFPSAEFTLSAIYGPTDLRALCGFWRATAEWAPSVIDESRVLIGDFNAGETGADAVDYRFRVGPAFVAFRASGFRDLWREQHGATQEFTWFSTPPAGRPRNGFRIDHAFGTPSITPRVVDCVYDHAVREARLSDHSLLRLDLRC